MPLPPSAPPTSNASVPHAPVFFLATPVHDGRIHHAYMVGVVQLSETGRLILSRYTSSSMPTSRDILTARFLRSRATHLLCVNPDIGWGVTDVQRLLLANRDFVSGVYARKQADRALALDLLERREGQLIEASFAPAGFLLLTRACVERMVAAHPELVYSQPTGDTCALWAPIFDGKPYGEELAFCARWRALGGAIWAHSGVVVERYGDALYLPAGFEGQP